MISVVVCTYNGAGRIGGTLEALARQDAGTEFEVIVVDDGSSDNVASVVAGHDVRFIPMEHNVGLSAARNAGIEAARGEIIAFCDDDCRPEAGWVNALAAAWATAGEDVHGIGGTVRAAELDTMARRYAEKATPLRPLELENDGEGTFLQRLRRYAAGVRDGEGRRSVASLVGANMSFRAESLRLAGSFDPVITFGGDEEAVCRSLRGRFGPGCLIVEPGIVMPHSYHPTLRDTFRRAVAYGRGSGREWARHGGIPALRPGFWGVMAGIAAGVVVAAAGRRAAGAWSGIGAILVVPCILWRNQVKGHEAERFAYPHLSLLLEAANTYGFWQGWVRQRRADRENPQSG